MYSEGDLAFLALISACLGLKGILNLHGTIFAIKPICMSKNFEHMIYSISLK